MDNQSPKRIYKAKPTPSALDLVMKKSHYLDNRRTAAKLMASVGLPSVFDYKSERLNRTFTITVLVPPYVRDSNSGGKDEWVTTELKAVDKATGEEIFIDNPCHWQDPWYKVQDGTWHQEPHQFIPGQLIDVANEVDDPAEAFKQQVTHLVEIMAARSSQ